MKRELIAIAEWAPVAAALSLLAMAPLFAAAPAAGEALFAGWFGLDAEGLRLAAGWPRVGAGLAAWLAAAYAVTAAMRFLWRRLVVAACALPLAVHPRGPRRAPGRLA